MHRATRCRGNWGHSETWRHQAYWFFTLFVYDLRRTGANKAVIRPRVSGRDQPDQVVWLTDLPAELQMPNGDSGHPVAVDPYVQQNALCTRFLQYLNLFEVASGEFCVLRLGAQGAGNDIKLAVPPAIRIFSHGEGFPRFLNVEE